MSIRLKTNMNIVPKKILTARQIPIKYQKEAGKVISDAIKSGTLVPVTEPTDWISPAFFVPKENGTDFTHLNKFMDRPVHPFPSSRDIIQAIKLTSKWFAKLDAVNGHFQIPFDRKSQLLTTILLPQGRYCYTRTPMGLLCSSVAEDLTKP